MIMIYQSFQLQLTVRPRHLQSMGGLKGEPQALLVTPESNTKLEILNTLISLLYFEILFAKKCSYFCDSEITRSNHIYN